MKVSEFVNEYKNGKINDLRETLDIRDYVPFGEKYELCASVLNACNDTDEKTGVVTIDSINRQITFIITVVSAYTNLEFSLDDNTEIVHSDMLTDGKVKVYIEKPDEKDCFHHATCYLPDYEWVDISGFTTLEITFLEKDELKYSFPEFKEYNDLCKFRGCLHYKEPGCAVKEAIEDKKINKYRYDFYVKTLEEIMSRRKYK